jgi:ribosome-interacting GTPase 1
LYLKYQAVSLINEDINSLSNFNGKGRLNKERPNLTFRRKDKGGINFTSTVANTNLDLETVKAICSEYRIHNADISLRYDATADDLIDVIEGSRVYIPCIYVVNKIDQITLEELEILDKLPHYCPIRLVIPLLYLSVCVFIVLGLGWSLEGSPLVPRRITNFLLVI